MVDGVPVLIDFDEGLVGIINDEVFRRVVTGRPETVTKALFDQVQAHHQRAFGRAFEVRFDSFVVEIWGHLYAQYLLLKYRSVLKVVLLFGLYDRFYRSCEVIDCGERGRDPNRWVWDILVLFRKMLGRQLTKIRRSQYMEGHP